MPFISRVDVYTDGAARGNPGPAAIAYSIFDQHGTKLDSDARYIGVATNNEAEYHALILAMDKACAFCTESAHFHLDSQLVVRQVAGSYQARNNRMKKFKQDVLAREVCFKDFGILYVPRENERIQEVDRMVNNLLDRRGFKKRPPAKRQKASSYLK